ncbi:uncharacterized protein LOC143300270 [Babylonia areolata]|uniref:uncharacterized protein LOC143300270 n=1 Tax=Babylonia areolata TaxID=304850 RepID=UPI003FD63B44
MMITSTIPTVTVTPPPLPSPFHLAPPSPSHQQQQQQQEFVTSVSFRTQPYRPSTTSEPPSITAGTCGSEPPSPAPFGHHSTAAAAAAASLASHVPHAPSVPVSCNKVGSALVRSPVPQQAPPKSDQCFPDEGDEQRVTEKGGAEPARCHHQGPEKRVRFRLSESDQSNGHVISSPNDRGVGEVEPAKSGKKTEPETFTGQDLDPDSRWDYTSTPQCFCCCCSGTAVVSSRTVGHSGYNSSTTGVEKFPKPTSQAAVLPPELTTTTATTTTTKVPQTNNNTGSNISNNSHWNSQLQSVRVPFRVRRWFPLSRECLPEPTVLNYRPPGSRPPPAPATTTNTTTTTTIITTRGSSQAQRAQQQQQQQQQRQRPHSTPAHRVSARGSRHQMKNNAGKSSERAAEERRPLPPDDPLIHVTRLRNTPQEDGNFDTLSPQLISQLLYEANHHQHLPMRASYEDSALTKAAATSVEKKDRHQDFKVNFNLNDDQSTTSGVESDGEVDEEEVEDVSNVNQVEKEEDGDDDNGSEMCDEADDSSDSDSENDGGFEPSLEDLRRQMPNPGSLFPLPPEQLDESNGGVVLAEDKANLQQQLQLDFFDTRKSVPPLYKFKQPLPDFLHKLDLRRCAREKSSWRDVVVEGSSCNAMEALPPPLQALVDRLVELERMQMVTEDWEAKKGSRGRSRRSAEKTSTSNSNYSGSRGGGGASGRQRERRPVCPCPPQLVGSGDGGCPDDCHPLETQPSSVPRCPRCCRESWCCSGNCGQDPRSQQQRIRRDGHNHHQDFGDSAATLTVAAAAAAAASSPSSLAFRGCLSSLKRPRTRQTQAGQPLQTRPKSCAVSSENRVLRSSSHRQRDFRPTSAFSGRASLLRDLEHLGLDAQQQQSVPAANRLSRGTPKSPYGVWQEKCSKPSGKVSGSGGGAEIVSGKKKVKNSVRTFQTAS